MTRKFVDATAFVAMLFIGWLWITDAIGQSVFTTPGNQTVPGYVPLGLGPTGIAGGPGLANSGYPPGATTLTATFTGADTSSAAANFTVSSGTFGYLCGFNVSGLGATAATVVTPTITNLANATTFTLTGAFSFASGATTADVPLTMNFNPCLRGGNITVTVPGAAGNTATSINMWGYQQ